MAPGQHHPQTVGREEKALIQQQQMPACLQGLVLALTNTRCMGFLYPWRVVCSSRPLLCLWPCSRPLQNGGRASIFPAASLPEQDSRHSVDQERSQLPFSSGGILNLTGIPCNVEQSLFHRGSYKQELPLPPGESCCAFLCLAEHWF